MDLQVIDEPDNASILYLEVAIEVCIYWLLLCGSLCLSVFPSVRDLARMKKVGVFTGMRVRKTKNFGIPKK